MPKYKVELEVTLRGVYLIEAENDEDADTVAFEKFSVDGDYSDSDTDHWASAGANVIDVEPWEKPLPNPVDLL